MQVAGENRPLARAPSMIGVFARESALRAHVQSRALTSRSTSSSARDVRGEAGQNRFAGLGRDLFDASADRAERKQAAEWFF
jgi:hypothetical protein